MAGFQVPWFIFTEMAGNQKILRSNRNKQQANEVVAAWVKKVSVAMSTQPARPVYTEKLPMGLQTISNIVAVSSFKGGVGKSTVAVNLTYTLVGMGARVGIFDVDVYGPSLPTMVSPENRLLEMNTGKKTIIPTEYMGVKLVSFGFAGQGRAIMRGPMVSAVRESSCAANSSFMHEVYMPNLDFLEENDDEVDLTCHTLFLLVHCYSFSFLILVNKFCRFYGPWSPKIQ